jgi:DNA transposition AAA+ family ATPase
VDEADRLHMNSLEVIKAIFDDGGIGMVLIGMPGVEKRVARFPQFYSRIGFVHQFRPPDEAQLTTLLNKGWLPAGVRLPDAALAPDMIATLIRMSGGIFRLLTRLLAQVERVLKVNQAEIVSREIVTAARDSLVTGRG